MKRNLNGSKFMLFLMVWVFVFVALLQFLFSVLSGRGVDVNAILTSPWLLIGQQLAIFILPLCVWLFVRGEKLGPSLPNMKLGGKNIILLIAISFLIQPVMMTISAVMSQFVTNDVATIMGEFTRHPMWLTFFAIAVTPAICEELVFRGYIQSQYRHSAIKKAAIINGLFFAIIHLNLHQFAYAFAMGVIFAYLVHYTRSIWAGIIPHFIINATQAVLFRLAISSEPYGYATEHEAYAILAQLPISAEVMALIIIAVIAICLSPVIVIVFREFFSHNKWRLELELAGDEFHADYALVDKMLREPLEGEETVKRGFAVDYYTLLVVVIFIVFTVLMVVV